MACPAHITRKFLDVLRRSHVTVEDPGPLEQGYEPAQPAVAILDHQRRVVLAANIGVDPSAWARLLGLHDQPELARAKPDTLRYQPLHLPAKLTTHARRRPVTIADTWLWADALHSASTASACSTNR